MKPIHIALGRLALVAPLPILPSACSDPVVAAQERFARVEGEGTPREICVAARAVERALRDRKGTIEYADAAYRAGTACDEARSDEEKRRMLVESNRGRGTRPIRR